MFVRHTLRRRLVVNTYMPLLFSKRLGQIRRLAAAAAATALCFVTLPATGQEAETPTASSAPSAGAEPSDGWFARWKQKYLTREYWDDWYAGGSVNVNQQPYLFSDPDILPFPTLTRVRDYTFTRQVTSIREGTALLRVVQNSPWELSLVGSIDARGYDPKDNVLLEGLDRRKWTLLGGLGGAWRGDHLYVETYAQTDLLGRSNGQRYEISFGAPMRLKDDRIELIPHIDVVHDSASAIDYYFGVPPDRAVEGRPAFEGRATTGLRLVTRGSYRFSGRFALMGRIGVRFLGDEVTDSPLVDNDTVWSGSVTLVYKLGKEERKEQ
jgi:outer membrane protein